VLTLNPLSRCTFVSMGLPCGGTTSAGTSVPNGPNRTIALLGSGCFANGLVISALGSINGGPMLPGGCQLLTDLTDASILVPQFADGAGVTVHTFSVPIQAEGTLFHQFVPIDLATFTFRASNGLALVLAP
jgi:hypothetical protein